MATMLAQASATPEQINALFVEILSRLNGEDINLLESIIPKDVIQNIKAKQLSENIYRTYAAFSAAVHDATFEVAKVEIQKQCASTSPRSDESKLQEVLDTLILNISTGARIELITAAFYGTVDDDIYSRNEIFEGSMSLDVLVASGLLGRRHTRFSCGDVDFAVDIIAPTPLGLQFVGTSRGDFLSQTKK